VTGARFGEVLHCSGSGASAAPGLARWLSIAAAPTFAAMAVWTQASGGASPMLCTSDHSFGSIDGMAAMYALMAIFHAGRWIEAVRI